MTYRRLDGLAGTACLGVAAVLSSDLMTSCTRAHYMARARPEFVKVVEAGGCLGG